MIARAKHIRVKVSDHHAIIPTAELAKADISKLADTGRNILSLIASRLVCGVGEKHVYEAVTASFDCNSHSFTAKGKTTVADGWKAIETRFTSALKPKDTDADTEGGGALPPITEGQTFYETRHAPDESKERTEYPVVVITKGIFKNGYPDGEIDLSWQLDSGNEHTWTFEVHNGYLQESIVINCVDCNARLHKDGGDLISGVPPWAAVKVVW